MVDQYLVVRNGKVLLNKQHDEPLVRVRLGSMSSDSTDKPLAFQLSEHSRLFNHLIVDFYIQDEGCISSERHVGRTSVSLKGIADSSDIVVDITSIEGAGLALNELKPLPYYDSEIKSLGKVELSLKVVNEKTASASDVHLLKDQSIISGETDIMMAIKAIGATVSAFSAPTFETGDVMGKALLTLIKYYQRRPYLPDFDYVSSHRFTDNEKLTLAKHMFPFAMASIGWVGVSLFGFGAGLQDLLSSNMNLTSALRFLDLEKEDVLRHEFSTQGVLKPSFVVFRAKKLNGIVIAMRGSIDNNDGYADMMCDYAEFMGGYTHSGVLKCTQWVYDHTHEIISKEKDLKNVYFTGHSLGGGISVLLSMMYRDKFGSLGINFRCVAFAPPLTITPNLLESTKDMIDVYAYGEDAVPHLSYGGGVDVQTLQRYCAYLHDKYPDLSESELYNCIDQCRKSIKEKSTALKLCHPGTVVHMAVVNNQVIGIECPNDCFQEIRLSLSMYGHHVPNWYGWALGEVCKNIDRQ